VLVLVGPTAIGKTELSLQLAEQFNCEIVSVDSMQVYRYMDIGTAKVSVEERARIPHHLIDLVEPDAEYDAACFVRDAMLAIADIHGRGRAGIMEVRLALPQRSPYPFMVPCTCLTPRLTANSELATAVSESLWA